MAKRVTRPETDAKPCSGCGDEPRKPGQRYGHACAAAATRRWRESRELNLTDGEMALIRALRAAGSCDPSLSSPRWPPGGPDWPVLGENDGIRLAVAPHGPGCLAVSQDRDFGAPWGALSGLVHVCDWPALRAAVDALQSARADRA